MGVVEKWPLYYSKHLFSLSDEQFTLMVSMIKIGKISDASKKRDTTAAN